MSDTSLQTTTHHVVNPDGDEIVDALADYYRCPPAVALAWLTGMFRHWDPKAAAERLAART